MTHRSSRAGPTIRCTTVRAAEACRSAADHERHFKEAPMSATSPTRLSYDVFVSDGPAGAGDERVPDGAPLAWSPLSTTLDGTRCQALFASELQRSDAPTAESVTEAISRTVRRLGTRACAARTAQQFADHPQPAA